MENKRKGDEGERRKLKSQPVKTVEKDPASENKKKNPASENSEIRQRQ